VSAALAGIADAFRRGDRIGTLSREDRLDGLTALVTGGSSGLGFATAIALAGRGARVIVASRSAGPDLESRLRRELGDFAAGGSIRAIPLDLSRFNSVTEFIRLLEREGRSIHLLVSNAGMVSAGLRHTPDGFDEMLQVNYLGPYLLVRKLLAHDLLASSPQRRSRLIFVSSEAHRSAPDPDPAALFSLPPYGMSGAMSTNIAREAPALLQPLLSLVFALLFPSPRRAAEPVEFLAASRRVEGRSGLYLQLMSEKDKDPRARNPELGAEVWRQSAAVLQDHL